jgi:hypothetical protein
MCLIRSLFFRNVNARHGRGGFIVTQILRYDFPNHPQNLRAKSPFGRAEFSQVEVLCRVDVLELSPPEIDFGSCRARNQEHAIERELPKKPGRIGQASRTATMAGGFFTDSNAQEKH